KYINSRCRGLVETPARKDSLPCMEKHNVGGANCYSCGSPVRAVSSEDGWTAQCSRCVNIEELLEQLIRRQLRGGNKTQQARQPVHIQHDIVPRRLRVVHSHGSAQRAC